jgi:uncharacterized damage-inducible protein DinB
VPDLHRIQVKLHLAQRSFLTAADSIPPHLWRVPPANRAWSAAEIVAHLCQVERAVIGTADRIIRHEPRPVPLFRRFHIPLILVELRLFHRKSPIPIDPELLSGRESMLAGLRSVRERTLAFLQETSARNLRQYRWPQAFLGMLNSYEWFQLIASHQIRHSKQVRSLAMQIPKLVGTSQK